MMAQPCCAWHSTGGGFFRLDLGQKNLSWRTGPTRQPVKNIVFSSGSADSPVVIGE